MGNEATLRSARVASTPIPLDEEIRRYLAFMAEIDSSKVRFIPEFCDRVRESSTKGNHA